MRAASSAVHSRLAAHADPHPILDDGVVLREQEGAQTQGQAYEQQMQGAPVHAGSARKKAGHSDGELLHFGLRRHAVRVGSRLP